MKRLFSTLLIHFLLWGALATPSYAFAPVAVIAGGVPPYVPSFSAENFTTYTIAGTASRVVNTSASVVTITSLAWSDTTRDYKDHGAGFYSGRIDMRFAVKQTATSVAGGQWDTGFTQTPNANVSGAFTGFTVSVRAATATTYDVVACEYVAGVATCQGAIASGIANGTYTYITLTRTLSGGSFGTLYWYAHSDSNRTTLIGSKSALATSNESYQYTLAETAYGALSTHPISGTVESMSTAKQ